MRYTVAVAILSLVAAPLAAQSECSTAGYGGSPGRACQAFIDAARAFHPLAGMIVSGGAPVLGTGETLRGLGHLSVSARVNAIHVSVPNPDSAGSSSVPSSFDGLLPAPVIEAALGLLDGGRARLRHAPPDERRERPVGRLERRTRGPGRRRAGVRRADRRAARRLRGSGGVGQHHAPAPPPPPVRRHRGRRGGAVLN